MSDLVINLDTHLPPQPRKSSEGSRKHQRFLRCRRFLERKGFLKQKQLPAWDCSRGCARMDQERGKKRQKVERKDSPAGNGGAGRERHPLQAGSSAHRPKESTACGAKEPGSRACPPATSRTGLNGAVEARKGSLLSEYESGLSSAPGPVKPAKVVAIDCEMVGTGPGGRNSDLARCSIVSYYGDVMYDKYVRPVSPITNYRTRWSGIRKHHMTNAVPFKAAQKEILKVLSGKIVVGHAIHNDFKALKYFHPKSLTRDTSKIPLLNRKAGFPENELASLKRLTKQLLHRDIQVGKNGHSSVEDAQATMELYKVIEAEWEKHLAVSPAQD